MSCARITLGFSLCAAIAVGAPARALAEEPYPEGREADAGADGAQVDAGDLGEPYETVVRGVRVRGTEDATAFGETIAVSEPPPGMSTVGDAIAPSVGVDVRTMGGPGAHASVSVRGSTASQVPVILDGVLLNVGGFAAVDVGSLGLSALDRIEIYRGHAPPSLAAAGIGGAIVLRTKAFDRAFTEIAATCGSFGTARLLVLHANRAGPLRALALGAFSTSRGDFVYLDRNGTLHDASDDAYVERRNNTHTAYETFVKVDGGGRLAWTIADDFGAKRQGIPGTESVPATRARLDSWRNALALSARLPLPRRVTLEGDASYLVLADALSDPGAEVGLGTGRSGSRADAVGGGLALSFALPAGNRLSLRADGRFERFAWDAAVVEDAPAPARRGSAGLVLADEWAPGPRVAVVPAVRIELQHRAFDGGPIPGRAGETAADDSEALFVQPAIGARWGFGPGFAARLNLGRYVRAPDLSELFGDRGVSIGNPELRPEVAWSADAGLAWEGAGMGFLRTARVEVAGFASAVKDLVAYVQNSQNTVRPENVSRAEIAGVEASAAVRLGSIMEIAASYTFLEATNRSEAPYLAGNRLPGRPRHDVYGRLALADRFGALAGRVAADVSYATGVFLDQANLVDAGLGTAIVGLELGVERVPERVELVLAIENLLDEIAVEDRRGRLRPISDYEGFPLPGRSFLATLRWRN